MDEDKLLPTPRAQDEYERRNWKTRKRIMEQGGDVTLPTWAAYQARAGEGSTPAVGQELDPPPKLLPTPDANFMNDGQSEEAWRIRRKRERAKGYNGNGGGTPLAAAVPLIAKGIDPNDERTSPSSPGSEGSTSPPRPTASPASDRSSGTPPAPESSSDGGRLFPVGETSPGSALLPSPTEGDHKSSGSRNLENNAHPGTSLTDAVRADRISSSAASPVSPYPPPVGAREPRTIAGSGRSSPVSLASWDPDTSSWRTSQVSLLSTEDERFPRSWERWPTSGMTRRGSAFALPTLEPAIGDNDSSSLLGTQRDRSGHWARPSETPGEYIRRLPTPTGSDVRPTYDHRASPGYVRAKPVPNLAAQVEELLPSPGAWLGRRPENSMADPQRAASRSHEGIRGKRSVELPEVLASLGDPTPLPSDDGSGS